MSVSSFRRYNLMDLPDALRLLANQIENGEYQAERAIVVLEAEDLSVWYRAFGKEPFTVLHGAGLAQAGCNMILEAIRK